jgi:hypothetical protein
MDVISRIRNPSFLNVGSKVKKGRRLVLKLLGFHFHMVHELVLENRIVSVIEKSDASLALMELRMMISMFVWHFDAEFVEVGQPEPFYEDAFVTMRGPLPLRVSPVHGN